MKLCQASPSSVIVSGAKDPISVYTTPTSARSFYQFLALISRVPPAGRFSDLEGATQ